MVICSVIAFLKVSRETAYNSTFAIVVSKINSAGLQLSKVVSYLKPQQK